MLPDQLARLPELESEYVAEVSRLLDQCQVSVHFVGRFRGKVPDGPSLKSAVQIQNEVASRKSEENGLHRVIWLPEKAASEQAEQQAFIDELQKVAVLQQGADLVTGDLNPLRVRSTLHFTSSKNRSRRPRSQRTMRRSIYLICDHRDRPATIPLRKFLKAEGMNVVIPLFEGDAATVRQANQDILARCDAVILFYGAGDEAWKRTVENDLIKMKAYRDRKPLLAKYVYLASPSTDDKRELIELEEPNLILGLDGFAEDEMMSLLNLLKS